MEIKKKILVQVDDIEYIFEYFIRKDSFQTKNIF